jgi:hypothetical protein
MPIERIILHSLYKSRHLDEIFHIRLLDFSFYQGQVGTFSIPDGILLAG